jgi:hypothetical protein
MMAARRQAHREKLWLKIDMLLDLVKVGCPANCEALHQRDGGRHEVPTSGKELRDLSVAYGILLDKYRLETGEKDGGGADIDAFLEHMGGTPPPSRRKEPSGAAKKVAKKVKAKTGIG